MNSAVILHGKPSRERYENPREPKPHEANWLPWLGKKLASEGIATAIPALPKPYFPIYADWKKVFEKHSVDQDTALIGHSAGAEFILRWLSETGAAVERVALVAPYHDFQRKYGEFSEYSIDKTIMQRVGRMTVINSLDDDQPIQDNVKRLAETLPEANLITLNGFGHFRIGHNMVTEEFPELLEELLR